jgi:hypothetical protein
MTLSISFTPDHTGLEHSVVWGLEHATEYNVALSLSSFVEATLFIVRKDGMGTQQPGNGVNTPSIHFVHF